MQRPREANLAKHRDVVREGSKERVGAARVWVRVWVRVRVRGGGYFLITG